MARSLSVLLVDDCASFLQAVAEVLTALPGIQVAGCTEDGEQAVTAAGQLHPDLVLLDLVLPDTSGLEVLRRIKSLPAPPLVIILTLHGGREYRMVAEAAGADGFIDKADFYTSLVPLISRLQSGGLPCQAGP